MPFHGHRLQAVGIGTHGQHAGIGCSEVTDKTPVTHAGEADEHVGGPAGNDEVAGRRGHAAIDERRVARIEHGDVDKLHGLAFLVDDSPRELALFLLRAFHEDHVGQCMALVVLAAADHFHADGIEADKLMDGVGHALVLHISSDLEVFEVVISKVDDVVLGDRAQIAKGV